MKAAEKTKNKLKNINTDSIRNMLGTLYDCNKRLKNIPLIIFTVLYIFSGIDIIPENIFRTWISYLDDVIILIFAAVYFYCSPKGMTQENDNEAEGKEGIYSHIIRNGSGSGYNIVIREINGNTACDDNSDGNDDVCADAYAGGTDENDKFNIERIIEEIEPIESVKPDKKVSDIEKTNEYRETSAKGKSVFEKKYEKIKPKEEMFEIITTENRSESFTVEEDEILW